HAGGGREDRRALPGEEARRSLPIGAGSRRRSRAGAAPTEGEDGLVDRGHRRRARGDRCSAAPSGPASTREIGSRGCRRRKCHGRCRARRPFATAWHRARAVAADPEAWRHYADGRRLASEGRNMEAMGEYQRALAVDEDFPLAHLELAEVDEYSDVEAKEKHLDAALRGIDRLPPKERELVQATRARLKGRLQEAIELYDRAIAAWPQDPRLSVGAA